MSFFDLPDGVVEFDSLSEVEIMSMGGRRLRTRPNLTKSVTKLAASLMRERRITNRDYHILETLYGATPILSRHQIQRLFWPDAEEKTATQLVSNRLSKLVYPYYALNVNPNTVHALASAGLEPCFAYYLDKVGIRLLEAQREAKGQPFRTPTSSYHAMAAPLLLLHDLMVSELFVHFVLRAQQDNNLRLRWIVQWQSIIRNQANKEVVRPDAGIIVHHNQYNTTNHYYLELDRRKSSSQSFWQDKVQKYEMAVSDGRWRGKFGMREFPTIMVVSQHIAPKKLIEGVRQHVQGTRWLFRSWESMLAGSDILHGWYNLDGEFTSLLPQKMI